MTVAPEDLALASVAALAVLVAVPRTEALAVLAAIMIPVAIPKAHVDAVLAGADADLRGGRQGQRQHSGTCQSEDELSHSKLL
jgi:hypothetical protein